MISIKIIGDVQLIRYLQGLPDNVGKQVEIEIKRQTKSLLRLAKEKANNAPLKNGLTLKRRISSRARNWRVNLPERSFLCAALRELRPEIIAALNAAVERGIKK